LFLPALDNVGGKMPVFLSFPWKSHFLTFPKKKATLHLGREQRILDLTLLQGKAAAMGLAAKHGKGKGTI
jgi:hypothetical protein